MLSLYLAPFAEFLEFDFTFDELTVFARPIIDARAFATSELEKLILRHRRELYS